MFDQAKFEREFNRPSFVSIAARVIIVATILVMLVYFAMYAFVGVAAYKEYKKGGLKAIVSTIWNGPNSSK